MTFEKFKILTSIYPRLTADPTIDYKYFPQMAPKKLRKIAINCEKLIKLRKIDKVNFPPAFPLTPPPQPSRCFRQCHEVPDLSSGTRGNMITCERIFLGVWNIPSTKKHIFFFFNKPDIGWPGNQFATPAPPTKLLPVDCVLPPANKGPDQQPKLSSTCHCRLVWRHYGDSFKKNRFSEPCQL